MSDITDLPTYTVEDHDSFDDKIARTPGLELPITAAPMNQFGRVTAVDMSNMTPEERSNYLQVAQVANEIVATFFRAIDSGWNDIVSSFIAKGYVSPDAISNSGETPLLAAVRVNRLPMISTLISLGATVDGYGTIADDKKIGYDHAAYPERTPLQYAASKGNLAMVKALMEDYGADDALIAPDGAMALRLAASKGHRDVVQYLPVRRGGAWKRWKTAHAVEVQRIKGALKGIGRFVRFFVWVLPKALLYDLPKHTGKWVIKNHSRIRRWCVRQVVNLPQTIKRVGKKTWKVIKEIPQATKELFLSLGRMIKKIPAAIKAVLAWVGNGLKKAGAAVANVVRKFFSLIHTFFMAVVTFFRQITINDVWNGFCYLLEAVFVELPKTIWSYLKTFGDMAYDVLVKTFKIFGGCVFYLFYGLFVLIRYIPKQIWKILTAIGRSLARGYSEVMAYLNPKRI